jgi:chromosome segregation ATPase
VKALKKKNEKEIANLTKKYEEELAKAQRDHESAIKTMNTVQSSFNAKDERIKTLAKDIEAALAELAALRREKAKWESEKDGLEATIGSSMRKVSNMRWIR